MTLVKYATIGHARNSDSLILIRGKKTGQVGFRPDEDTIFGDPIYSERVVQLPEQMSPTDYEEYVEETVGHDRDDPVTRAMVDVADDLGIDLGDAWGPVLEGSA